jgi:hypothetical protein
MSLSRTSGGNQHKEEKSSFIGRIGNGLYAGADLAISGLPIYILAGFVEALLITLINAYRKEDIDSFEIPYFAPYSLAIDFSLFNFGFFASNPLIDRIFVGPIREELIDRGLIRGSIKWALTQIMPKDPVFQKFAKTTSAILSSISFSAGHHNATKLDKFIIGMRFCKLNDELEVGLFPSIVSHIVHNTIASGPRPIAMAACLYDSHRLFKQQKEEKSVIKEYANDSIAMIEEAYQKSTFEQGDGDLPPFGLCRIS